MRCLLVPRPIFAPIARRDLFPRVVEVYRLLEVFHCVVVCPMRVRCRSNLSSVATARRELLGSCISCYVLISPDGGCEWVWWVVESEGMQRFVARQRPKSKPCARQRSSGLREVPNAFHRSSHANPPQYRLKCGLKIWRNRALANPELQRRGALICPRGTDLKHNCEYFLSAARPRPTSLISNLRIFATSSRRSYFPSQSHARR
jgi:hypothetical protein